MAEIPCGKEGFLYPGACSDTCGSPYWTDERDARTGHECCSTVAEHYKAIYDALHALTTCDVLTQDLWDNARAALARARGETQP